MNGLNDSQRQAVAVETQVEIWAEKHVPESHLDIFLSVIQKIARRAFLNEGTIDQLVDDLDTNLNKDHIKASALQLLEAWSLES